jgi:TonB family protein
VALLKNRGWVLVLVGLAALLSPAFDLPWRPIWEQHDVVDDAPPLRVLQAPTFVYPWALRKTGVQGSVTVGLVVSPNGQVSGVTLEASSGNALLDGYVRKTAWAFRFTPWTSSLTRQTEIVVRFLLSPNSEAP